jgi:glycosyltransferase involved in cell wall biosynthesis
MLPVKMMEYLLVGLPVAVPSLRVIREYFSDEMVSYFEPENVQQLAERIMELAQRPELRVSQVKAADAFFDRYPWVKQKKMYCDFALGTAQGELE